MIELLAAAALAPWAHPLRFGPLAGWRRDASGTVPSLYDNVSSRVRSPKMSTAWIATANVRYRDPVTSDPPNRTLMHLPRDGVIVWAVVFESRPGRLRPIGLDLRRARHYACVAGRDRVGVRALAALDVEQALAVRRPREVVALHAQRPGTERPRVARIRLVPFDRLPLR